MENSEGRRIEITVSGSFNRHWDAIKSAANQFRSAGFAVLSPADSDPERSENGFVYLKGERGNARDIEQHHLDAIASSDALYVVSSGGYMGASVALEIGYALALRVPVWTSEQLTEVPHRDLVHVGSVPSVIAELRKGSQLSTGIPTQRTSDLQAYYRQFAKEHHFHTETPTEALVLLVEEVGELAKAIRPRMGVSMREDDPSKKSVRLELADCFAYVLHMANQTGNDLYEAFLEKQQLNAARTWLPRERTSITTDDPKPS